MADTIVGIKLKGDGSGLINAARLSTKEMEKLQASTDRASAAAKRGAASSAKYASALATLKSSAISMGSALLTAFGARTVLQNTIRQEQAVAQLNATIKSTGSAAGLTSRQMQDMAASLQLVTTFGDEATIEAQALLATFTEIGSTVFPRATAAILDLSTALGSDLRSATTQVGKALNDPIAGLTSLTRSGVQFTEAQKDTIRTLVEMGDVAGAQTVILNELERQFGGSAKAARDTLGGALTALGNAFGDLLEIGTGATRPLTDAINALANNLETVAKAGLVLASVGLPRLFTLIGGAALAAAKGVTAFTVALAKNPVGLLAVGLSTATAALLLFGDETIRVGDTTASTWDFIRATWDETAGNLVAAASESFAEMAASSEGFAGAVLSVAGSILSGFGSMYGSLLNLAKSSINSWIALFVALGNSVSSVWEGIKASAINAFSAILDAGAGFWKGVQSIFDGELNFSAFNEAISRGLFDPMAEVLPRIQQGFDDAFSTDYVGEFAANAQAGFDALLASINKQAAAYQKAGKAADELGGALGGGGGGSGGAGGGSGGGSGGGGAAGKADKFSSSLQALTDKLDPAGRAARELAEDIDLLNEAMERGSISSQENADLIALATDAYVESQLPIAGVADSIKKTADSMRESGDAANETATTVDGATQVMIESWRRLDDVTASVWSDMLTGGKSALQSLKDFALNTLAELIHAFTTRPLILQIGAALGLTGASGTASATGAIAQGAGAFGVPNPFSFLTGGPFGTTALGSNALYGVGATGLAGNATASTLAGGAITGAAGFAGNFLGNSLFGSRPGHFADIGGGVGAIGGSLAASAALGASGAAAGTAIGSVVPVIGTIVGAVLGNFLGGKIGRAPVPPQGSLLTSSTTTGDVSGAVDDALFAWNKFAEGAFGAVGLQNIITKGDFKIEPFEETFSQIAQLDNAIASFLTPEEVGDIRERLDGWTSAFQEGTIDIGVMVEERLGVIASEIAGGYAHLIDVAGEGNDEFLARLGALAASRDALGTEAFESMVENLSPLMAVAGEGVEEFAARVASLTDITMALSADPFTDFAAALEESSLTVWEAAGRQKDALLDLASAYDGSIAATQALAGASQAAYQTILGVLQQIESARRSVESTLSASSERLRDSTKTDEEKLADLAGNARDLFNELGSLTDPQKIAESSKGLASIAEAIFSLLPDNVEDPGRQGTLADRFLGTFDESGEAAKNLQQFIIDAVGVDPATLGIETKEDAANLLAGFLDSVGAKSQEQLNAAEEETRTQAGIMRVAVQSAMDSAAAQFAAAAAAMGDAAASIPREIAVNVNVNVDHTGSEVGA